MQERETTYFHVSGLPLFSRQTQSSAATSRCKLHPFAGQHAVGSTCESLTGSLEPLFLSSHDVSSWWTIQLSEIPLLISAKSISPCQQPSSFGGCSIGVVLFMSFPCRVCDPRKKVKIVFSMATGCELMLSPGSETAHWVHCMRAVQLSPRAPRIR